MPVEYIKRNQRFGYENGELVYKLPVELPVVEEEEPIELVETGDE